MSLADTPPNRLSYGEISNHSKQIKLARCTWKINVLGGGSCMTIRDFERWGMLPVWYGTCLSPCPSQLEKWAAIGQLSCRDACQAYRPVTNQAEKLQREHLPLFSLLSLTGITRGDWSTKNTAQIFTSFFALHLPLIFLSFFLLMPMKSCLSIFLLNVNFLNSFDITLYFVFNWLQFSLYDPALVSPAFA